MDGNGRWAKMRDKPRIFGHKAGVASARTIIQCAARAGVEVLSLFGFSSENWRRPKDEVEHIFSLFFDALGDDIATLHENNIQVRIIGERGHFESSLIEKIEATEKLTKNNTGLVLVIAMDYGGQWDICQGIKKIVTDVLSQKISPDAIEPQMFSNYLSLADLSDPDLFIRPGGEQRISNFFIWQLAYSELYFPNVYWPDFGEVEFNDALDFFSSRQRRFGYTGEQIEKQGDGGA